MQPHQLPRTVAFPIIPSVRKWIEETDRDVPVQQRPLCKDDPVLLKIDHLVELLNGSIPSNAEHKYILSILWFTVGYWRNHLKPVNPGVNPPLPGPDRRRLPAVTGLLICVQNELGKAFGCPGGNGLASKLTEIFGVTMSSHGHFCDTTCGHNSRFYLDQAGLEKLRIVFQQGRAYRFDWTNPNPSSRMLILTDTINDTAINLDDRDDMEEGYDGWGHFVMTMSGNLYMGKHDGTASETRLVHSCYTGGKPVQCAGSLQIKEGIVIGLANNSGHYQPSNASMVKVLEILKAVGMRPEEILIKPFKMSVCYGDEFLRRNGNLEAIQQERARIAWDKHKAGVPIFELVDRYFQLEKKNIMLCNSPEKWPGWFKSAWKAAWQGLCMELAMFDPTWKDKAFQPPIPMRHAPGRPVPPGKAPPGQGSVVGSNLNRSGGPFVVRPGESIIGSNLRSDGPIIGSNLNFKGSDPMDGSNQA